MHSETEFREFSLTKRSMLKINQRKYTETKINDEYRISEKTILIFLHHCIISLWLLKAYTMYIWNYYHHSYIASLCDTILHIAIICKYLQSDQ